MLLRKTVWLDLVPILGRIGKGGGWERSAAASLVTDRRFVRWQLFTL